MATLLYGGSFDPITNAHILCAREAMERGGFKEIIFIPCGDAPHKKLNAPFDHRLKMVQLAIRHEPGFDFSAIEGEWAKDGKKSYTIDTYRYMNSHIAGRDCWWLIGSDILSEVSSWHDFPSIQKEMKFCVVPRPGYNKENESAFAKNPTDLRGWLGLTGIKGKDVYTPLLEISSTYVRDRILRKKSIKALVPDSVGRYISRYRLYQ